MKKIILLLFLIYSNSVICQEKILCDEILQKEFNLDSITDNFEIFILDFKQLLNCKFDSIDFELLLGTPENYEVVASLLIGLSDQLQDSINQYSFGELHEYLLQVTDSEDYKNSRRMLMTSYLFLSRKANLSNWNDDILLMKEMGMNDSLISDIKKIIIQNYNRDWTYTELFQKYYEE